MTAYRVQRKIRSNANFQLSRHNNVVHGTKTVSVLALCTINPLVTERRKKQNCDAIMSLVYNVSRFQRGRTIMREFNEAIILYRDELSKERF